MDKHRINYLLRKKDFSGAQVGRLVGVSRSAVSRVIAGQRKSPYIRKAIADLIGKEVNALWPISKTIKTKKSLNRKEKKQTYASSIKPV